MSEDTDGQEDAQLMLAIAKGSESALVAIITRYQDAVYKFFRHMGCNFQLAEDCAQETFIRLYRHADQYSPRDAKLLTYILSIGRNIFFDKQRRVKDRGREVALTENNDPLDAATPALLAERREMRERVEAAMRDLPEIFREVLALAVLQDLPYEEVAAITGLPLGTVKSRIYNGLRTLRGMLPKQRV